MLLIMLMWTRYIVAYLDKDGWSSRVLLYMVWGLSILGLTVSDAQPVSPVYVFL